MANDYTFTRGDSFVFSVELTRASLPIDLLGAQLWVTAKLSDEDTDEDAVFQKTTDPGDGIVIDEDPQLGLAQVTIAPEDTAYPKITETTVLFFDVQVKEAGGRVSTPIKGTFTVETDYTRSDD